GSEDSGALTVVKYLSAKRRVETVGPVPRRNTGNRMPPRIPVTECCRCVLFVAGSIFKIQRERIHGFYRCHVAPSETHFFGGSGLLGPDNDITGQSKGVRRGIIPAA